MPPPANDDPVEDRYRYTSYQESRKHPDFQRNPWITSLLSAPNIEFISELPNTWTENTVNNTMFNYSLSHSSGIKARILFRRPSQEPDAISGFEDCFLLSLGTALDGATGRAHGGLHSVIMDHLLGTCARREAGNGDPPATATLTVDYRNPISTPCIVFARAWMLKESSGRKVWLRGKIEDESGKVLSEAKALFVNPRKAAAL